MAGLWVNECGNALDVELSAGVGGVEGRGRPCDDDLRLEGGSWPEVDRTLGDRIATIKQRPTLPQPA